MGHYFVDMWRSRSITNIIKWSDSSRRMGRKKGQSVGKSIFVAVVLLLLSGEGAEPRLMCRRISMAHTISRLVDLPTVQCPHPEPRAIFLKPTAEAPLRISIGA